MVDSPWIALTPPAAFGELSGSAELTEARAAQPDETVAWDVELSLPRGVVLRMRAPSVRLPVASTELESGEGQQE